MSTAAPTRIGMPSVVDTPENRELFTQMHRDGVGHAEIGAHFGICEESARRWSRRLGLRHVRGFCAFTQRQLADAADGIPATWNAEDSEFTVIPFRRMASKLPNAAERAHAWKQVWGEIRRRPELLELHREFAPRRVNKTSASVH